MLIEFSVTNFRSFRERKTLSLSASKYFHDLEDENCFETGIKGLPKLLKSAVIYGSNASGKSNLISSLGFVRSMVLSSAKKMQEGEEINVVPFLFDKNSNEKESEFEIIFIEDGVRYQYGFALNKRRFLREWLLAYPEGRPQKWFERKYDPIKNEDTYEFGSKLLGGRLREIWSNSTRSNALFLSVAVQLNNDQLKPVFNWFKEHLMVISSLHVFPPNNTCSACETDDGKNKILDFLNAADLSISNINIDKTPFEDVLNELPFPDEIKDKLKKYSKIRDVYNVKFMHKNVDTGELVPINAPDESEGTKNLFSFASPWFDVIDKDRILFVDEIDSSLHPLIVHHLIRLMHRTGKKAQIVFTTHDTTILNTNIMRRDQIWFIEKNKHNASNLYSLSDFKVRKKEAIEQGYLRGRYGGIPNINESSLI